MKRHWKESCACTLALGMIFGAAVTAAAQTGQSPAQLLVDLARDAAAAAGRDSPQDIELRVDALLRAAQRLDPRSADLLTRLYELAALRGDEASQRTLLDQLAAADPENDGVWLRRLELGPQAARTLEDRQRWTKDQLAGQNPRRQALTHVQSARLALQQLDRSTARQHVDEAKRAWPDCPDLAAVALEMLTLESPPTEKLAALLAAVRANPLNAELCWQVALLLDDHGLADEATPFFGHARSLIERDGTDGLSPRKRVELSRNALLRGDREMALDLARQAGDRELRSFEPALWLYWLHYRFDQAEAAEAVRARLREQVAAIDAPDSWPTDVVAQAAWLLVRMGEATERAEALLASAEKRAPGDAFTLRVRGWIDAQAGRADAATKALTGLERTDPYAAYRLAMLRKAAGDTAGAGQLLASLPSAPMGTHARALLEEAAQACGVALPGEDSAALATILRAFDRDLLDAARTSADWIHAEVSAPRDLETGAPWAITVSISNGGRHPLALGPDFMVNPVVLLSVELRTAPGRVFANHLTINLDQRRILAPGESVRVTQTLDVGELRSAARRASVEPFEVVVSGILAPEQARNGQWRPGQGGRRLAERVFTRAATRSDPDTLARWQAAAMGSDDAARQVALNAMAAALAESQRLASRGAPTPAGARQLSDTLAAALANDSPRVRFYALEALTQAGLDRTLFDRAQACLAHPDWLVRLGAVRLLSRQGAGFAETAHRLAESDPDELVKNLARSYAGEPAGAQP